MRTKKDVRNKKIKQKHENETEKHKNENIIAKPFKKKQQNCFNGPKKNKKQKHKT